jgi:stalled ribosome alternative rescue factor ArfA
MKIVLKVKHKQNHNLHAKALNMKIFKNKIISPKKGKGSYKRKDYRHGH